jgi:hypothetical protein
MMFFLHLWQVGHVSDQILRFMLYPTGFASMGTAAAPAVLALHVSGCGCVGVGFEVHLTLQLYGPGGAVPLMEAVEEKALAGEWPLKIAG